MWSECTCVDVWTFVADHHLSRFRTSSMPPLHPASLQLMPSQAKEHVMKPHTHVIRIYIYICICVSCIYIYIYIYIYLCANMHTRKAWVPPNKDPWWHRARCPIRIHLILAMFILSPWDPNTFPAFLHCGESLYLIKFLKPIALLPSDGASFWDLSTLDSTALLVAVLAPALTMMALGWHRGGTGRQQLWFEGTLITSTSSFCSCM